MDKSLSKIIDQRQLVSVMNKTKWRELCTSFSAEDAVSPNVRYKLISGNKKYGFSKVWWDELFLESSAIEWIEFEPFEREFKGKLVSDKKVDISYEILNVFSKHHIPYSIEGECYRVWGYYNGKSRPEFV